MSWSRRAKGDESIREAIAEHREPALRLHCGWVLPWWRPFSRSGCASQRQRRADERAGDHGVPSPSSRSLAPRHQAAGTEASARMAANEDNRQSLPAVSAHPASVARTTVSRQSSEVGARCGSAAGLRGRAAPAKASFVLGFLTGHEFEWLPLNFTGCANILMLSSSPLR
jgi:hypothetical protein